MRVMRVVLAVVALTLVGASSQGAMSRTQPTAKATAVAQWWRQTVRITYAGGSWEWGCLGRYGHSDARIGAAEWVPGGFGTWQQQPAWMLVGARIEVVGVPYPG